MEDKMIVTLSIGELRAIIAGEIQAALSQFSKATPDEILLKRKDVAKLFHISLVTLHEWMKEGRIPFHRVHSRVFFKRSEVMEILQNPAPIGAQTRNKLLHLTTPTNKKAA